MLIFFKLIVNYPIIFEEKCQVMSELLNLICQFFEQIITLNFPVLSGFVYMLETPFYRDPVFAVCISRFLDDCHFIVVQKTCKLSILVIQIKDCFFTMVSRRISRKQSS